MARRLPVRQRAGVPQLRVLRSAHRDVRAARGELSHHDGVVRRPRRARWPANVRLRAPAAGLGAARSFRQTYFYSHGAHSFGFTAPAPAPDAAELAFRRDLEAQLRLPEEGAGLAFADLDDSLSEPLGNLRAVAQWHDATGRPLPPTLVDTSFPHAAYNRHADRHAYVLLVDVWHPDLSEEERRALALFQAWKLPGGGLKKCFML